MAKTKANKQTRKQGTGKNEQQSGRRTAIEQSASAAHGSQQQMRKGSEQTKQASATGLSRREQILPTMLASPFSFMRRFGEDMEQLFEDFGLGGVMPRGLNQIAAWAPEVEVFQREGQLVIRADLPGVDKDNVQIELRDDSVVIRGEREEERKEEDEGFYRTERSYGSFYREIPLPAGADTENATANFRDGVLEITMPAPQGESRVRQLQIQDVQAVGQQQAKARTAGAGG
jgi:HSP20 family protein